MTHENHRIDALPHGSVLHTYMVERVLGSGAFGITYLAKHRHLDSWHVIKEYLPDCGARENNRSTVSPKSGGDKDLFDWGLKCFFDEAKLLYRGTYRVHRGGSWNVEARNVCAAQRNRNSPASRSSFVGFRLARKP